MSEIGGAVVRRRDALGLRSQEQTEMLRGDDDWFETIP